MRFMVQRNCCEALLQQIITPANREARTLAVKSFFGKLDKQILSKHNILRKKMPSNIIC
jgi:hypothetical protein